MKSIDKTKPVLVTGANGYLASWLVKTLLEDGLTVHAAVRNPAIKEKYAHLDKIAASSQGSIRYFAADLLTEGSYAEAMAGCELVYHTASPFTLSIKDAQKQLIDPAGNGTATVLNQANKTESVKRVLVTSSCAAIYTDAIDTVNAPNSKITEEIWNATSSLDYQPYSYSKTLAEKKAWEICNGQDRGDLVTINPSFVMGPALNPKTATSESISVLKQMGDGSMKMGVGVVDVRDVASAHYQAGFNPKAQGRYITSGHSTDFLEMALTLQSKFGDKYPLPKKALPKWLVMLVGPLTNPGFSRKMLRNNINVSWDADNSKIQNELGIKFRPLKETMEESFDTLISSGIIKAK